MRGRELFARVSGVLAILSTALRWLPWAARVRVLQLFRRRRGLIGVGLRYSALRALDCTEAANVSVREGVYLLGVKDLLIGANVSIHPMCYLDATGGITIGDDVSIAHGTTILSSTHRFDDLTVPIKDQGEVLAHTVIEPNCWIGAQAVILAGIRVGSGSVVAANSVVTKDVPAGVVVAGSPAKIVKHRA